MLLLLAPAQMQSQHSTTARQLSFIDALLSYSSNSTVSASLSAEWLARPLLVYQPGTGIWLTLSLSISALISAIGVQIWLRKTLEVGPEYFANHSDDQAEALGGCFGVCKDYCFTAAVSVLPLLLQLTIIIFILGMFGCI
jgi:hypothetical protein